MNEAQHDSTNGITSTHAAAPREAVRPPRTQEHLRQLEQVSRGERRGPGVATLIGFALTHVEVGRAVFELEAGPQHANPMGTLHGGILGDIADAAMGCAVASTLEDDESFTSLDLTVKFFKPVWSGRLTASGYVIRRTRSLGVVECDITDAAGSVVGRGYSTCMVLRGDAAKGR